MTLLQATGVAILIAITMSLLKEGGNRFALYVAAGGGLLLLVAGVARLSGVISDFRTLASTTVLSPYLTLILKAIGIGYVVGISADICRDLGAQETARRLEFWGRAELLLLAMPPLAELVKLACEMVEGV